MGQAKPSHTVTAQKCILTDDSGAIRAELGTTGEAAHLVLYGPHDKEASIIASGEHGWGGEVYLNDVNGSTRAPLETTPDGAVLNLWDVEGKSRAHLATGSTDVRRGPAEVKTKAFLIYGDVPGPSLSLEDQEGFSAVIGSVNLLEPEAGTKRHTSAASAALFSKNGTLCGPFQKSDTGGSLLRRLLATRTGTALPLLILEHIEHQRAEQNHPTPALASSARQGTLAFEH